MLNLVERSPLVILQQLVTTGPAGWSLSSGHSPKRAQRPRPQLGLQLALAKELGDGVYLWIICSLKFSAHIGFEAVSDKK